MAERDVAEHIAAWFEGEAVNPPKRAAAREDEADDSFLARCIESWDDRPKSVETKAPEQARASAPKDEQQEMRPGVSQGGPEAYIRLKLTAYRDGSRVPPLVVAESDFLKILVKAGLPERSGYWTAHDVNNLWHAAKQLSLAGLASYVLQAKGVSVDSYCGGPWRHTQADTATPRLDDVAAELAGVREGLDRLVADTDDFGARTVALYDHDTGNTVTVPLREYC